MRILLGLLVSWALAMAIVVLMFVATGEWPHLLVSLLIGVGAGKTMTWWIA